MNTHLFILASALLCILAANAEKHEYGAAKWRQHPKHGPVGHFCHCFKHMIDCVKRHRNRSMETSMETSHEKFAVNQMFMNDPMEMEEEMTVEKKNGSKGNHTAIKKCIHHFMRCIHRRPGSPPHNHEGMDVAEGMDKGEGMGVVMAGEKMHGGRFSIKNRIKGFLSKMRSGFASFFGKMKGKFAGKGGYKKGKFITHHHRHHHHRRPRKGPFFRCFVGAKICKNKAGRSKKRMKACAKKFARCILGQCRRHHG